MLQVDLIAGILLPNKLINSEPQSVSHLHLPRSFPLTLLEVVPAPTASSSTSPDQHDASNQSPLALHMNG